MRPNLSSFSNGSETQNKVNTINPSQNALAMEKGTEVPSAVSIPEVTLASGGHRMPVIGMGSAATPFDPIEFKTAVLESIKIGYRHFDTASVYGSEKALGEALAEAMERKLVTREELFITSKLWSSDAHPHLVASALQKSLRTLQLEYLDLYLIHWPISCKPVETQTFPIPVEDMLAMDYEGLWKAMEDCQRQGLTRSIGVSNFSCKKLAHILSFATIPPSVNQVEMNPLWQQRKLLEFCEANGVIVTAYSPLGAKGAAWGSNAVMEDETLNQMAEAHGKSVAQVCLRWIYEQGATFVVKSFNKERMKQNLEIFDWELREEDYEKMSKIPQKRLLSNELVVSPHGPFKSLEELWDGEI